MYNIKTYNILKKRNRKKRVYSEIKRRETYKYGMRLD